LDRGNSDPEKAGEKAYCYLIEPHVTGSLKLRQNQRLGRLGQRQDIKYRSQFFDRNTGEMTETTTSSRITNAERLKLLSPLLFVVLALLIPLYVEMSRFKLSPAVFNPQLYQRVSGAWFSHLPASPGPADYQASMKKWYAIGATPEEKRSFDELCRSTSWSALESIDPVQYSLPPTDASYKDELKHAGTISRPFAEHLKQVLEREGPEGASRSALSMVLLLDQMPRNIFRTNQSLIYNHYDRISRSFLRHLLASPERVDRQSWVRESPIHRWFFYLPLMHSEHLEDHLLWDTLAEEMRHTAVQKGEKAAIDFVDRGIVIAKQHKDIIELFGRYPYRNEVMDRNTTKKEREWLVNGETFGA